MSTNSKRVCLYGLEASTYPTLKDSWGTPTPTCSSMPSATPSSGPPPWATSDSISQTPTLPIKASTAKCCSPTSANFSATTVGTSTMSTPFSVCKNQKSLLSSPPCDKPSPT